MEHRSMDTRRALKVWEIAKDYYTHSHYYVDPKTAFKKAREFMDQADREGLTMWMLEKPIDEGGSPASLPNPSFPIESLPDPRLPPAPK